MILAVYSEAGVVQVIHNPVCDQWSIVVVRPVETESNTARTCPVDPPIDRMVPNWYASGSRRDGASIRLHQYRVFQWNGVLCSILD
jgi:hypothetical protein